MNRQELRGLFVQWRTLAAGPFGQPARMADIKYCIEVEFPKFELGIRGRQEALIVRGIFYFLMEMKTPVPQRVIEYLWQRATLVSAVGLIRACAVTGLVDSYGKVMTDLVTSEEFEQQVEEELGPIVTI